ncbi:MAG TPA: YggS family pyridoxal phosphate-dependent enzyme [Burkholderiaceae bacterium]|nr:YggS family pyridoxal phosphate-dependent enzyme [Burkholderiaceae bacterium]
MNGNPALRENHEAVLRRIAAAARAAGRDPASVRLLAVSKTFGADQVLQLADCGQRCFGENYLQEAERKIDECRDRRPELSLEWHFIGPIQSNKTRGIAARFDWVHSVDRLKIAQRLSEQRPPQRPPLNLCLQVNVSGEATKSGCAPDEVPALAAAVAALPRLALRGLMAIPEPPAGEPASAMAAQRARFGELRRLAERLRGAGLALDTLSMGMSADLEAAIAEGATIVRVGTALFGARERAAG